MCAVIYFMGERKKDVMSLFICEWKRICVGYKGDLMSFAVIENDRIFMDLLLNIRMR